MTKKRKIAAPATSRTTSDDRRAREQQELADFPAKMSSLYDFYAEHGCPCRFPRFRAVAARDTREVGAPGYSTLDQQALVTLFDVKVPLRDRVNVVDGHRASCAVCGSAIFRFGVEYFKNAFIEYLRVDKHPSVGDVGAGVAGPLPRCWPFFHLGPDTSDRALVEASYPRLSIDDWFAWMRAR